MPVTQCSSSTALTNLPREKGTYAAHAQSVVDLQLRTHFVVYYTTHTFGTHNKAQNTLAAVAKGY